MKKNLFYSIINRKHQRIIYPSQTIFLHLNFPDFLNLIKSPSIHFLASYYLHIYPNRPTLLLFSKLISISCLLENHEELVTPLLLINHLQVHLQDYRFFLGFYFIFVKLFFHLNVE